MLFVKILVHHDRHPPPHHHLRGYQGERRGPGIPVGIYKRCCNREKTRTWPLNSNSSVLWPEPADSYNKTDYHALISPYPRQKGKESIVFILVFGFESEFV